MPNTLMLACQVLDAAITFKRRTFVRPLVLSTGSIDAITQADAVVRVRVGDVEQQGNGCVYLSVLWSWPDATCSHAQCDAAMREYCLHLAAELPGRMGQAEHPLNLGLRLHDSISHDVATGASTPPLPTLARTVCASSFDAAIHDAVGRALGCSSFDLYEAPFPAPEADHYFGGPGTASAAIRELLRQSPRRTASAWWLIGHDSDLEQEVRPAVQQQGYFAFKLKIMGRDAAVDAARVAQVYQAVRRWGVRQPRLAVDSNESNPDAASVAQFLDLLESQDAEAYRALEMIEQPTARDIEQHAFDWSSVSSRKPVMVDEGLTGLGTMAVARDQHWSGFALKTCKGHSFMLTAAAWARTHQMLVSLQDLTNPGLAAVHSALFASRVNTLNGIELNSLQFTPAANADWIADYPSLFQVSDGVHQLPDPATQGLGGRPPAACPVTADQ